MKAAVFYEKNKIAVEERKCRRPGPKEVLIQVKAAGVCGTDMHIYAGAKGASECYPPVVLGHEFAGVIAEVGEEVKDLEVGDHVTVDPSIMCGSCEECQKGIPHFCQQYSAVGVTYDGGFAEYCTVAENQVYKLNASVSFEEGAMCEPVGCCIHGIDRAHIKAGDVVLIIGAGTIGLIMMQLARFSGASAVIVSEPVEEKRKKALELGADMAALSEIYTQASETGIKVMSWDENMECAEILVTSQDYEKEVYKTITPVTAENVDQYD